MLSFLLTPLVFILSTYLAFTNLMADGISTLFGLENNIAEEVMETNEMDTSLDEDEEQIKTISSLYELGSALPDILIKNASYQHASVIGSLGTQVVATTSIEAATVNIFCTYTTETYKRTTTGTGFFVNYNGVILTNAHVAQFLLLEYIEGGGETECLVRTGETATPKYEVDLLYISPAWIQKHANLINETQPKGTGERDYALLYVTAGVDNTPIPARIPYLASHTDLLTVDTHKSTVTIGGYPAEELLETDTTFDVTQRTATTTVVEMFTFGSNYADLFLLASTPIGQHGISGGPVINAEGEVIGIISTKGTGEEETDGSLNAITLSYIHRTILEETGFGFAESISGDLPFRAQIFKETIVPFLSHMLAREL